MTIRVFRFIPRRCSLKKAVLLSFALLVLTCLRQLFHFPFRGNKRDVHPIPNALLKRLGGPSIDSSGNFKTNTFVVASEAIFWDKVQKDGVTIVTHSSISELHHLEALAQRWAGPISVAVFATDSNIFLSSVRNLRRCFPPIKQHVSFHLVTPTSGDDSDEAWNDEIDLKVPCGMVLHLTRNLEEGDSYASGNLTYPLNILQNIAVRGSVTEYLFTLNIDLLPSKNLFQDFKLFINKKLDENPKQEIYVLPDFEISDDEPSVPNTKDDLLEMWRKNNDHVRLYRYGVCSSCHPHGNYSKWRSVLPTAENKLDIAYEVDVKYPWQPFYIASRDTPLYNEGALHPVVLSPVIKICQLYIIGYKFMVLNNAFVASDAFATQIKPTKLGIDNPKVKMHFREVEQQLRKENPGSSRTCS